MVESIVEMNEGHHHVAAGNKDGSQKGVDPRVPIKMHVLVPSDTSSGPREIGEFTPNEYAVFKGSPAPDTRAPVETPLGGRRRRGRIAPSEIPQEPPTPATPPVSNPAVGVVEPQEGVAPPPKHYPEQAPLPPPANPPDVEVVFHLSGHCLTSYYHDVIITPDMVILVFDTTWRYGDRITLGKQDDPVTVLVRGEAITVGVLGLDFAYDGVRYTILVKQVGEK